MEEQENIGPENRDKMEKQNIDNNDDIHNGRPSTAQNNTDNNNSDLSVDYSISEHISSISGSIENDRSLQEIEIFNQPTDSQSGNISREMKPRSFLDDASDKSDSTTVAEKTHSPEKNVKSIMEEILTSDQFHSDSNKSPEESFNLFANVNLDDTSLLNLSNHSPENSIKNPAKELNFVQKTSSFNGQILFATDFDVSVPHTSPKEHAKYLEEILEVKEATIKALKSELESLRDNSNTLTSSVTSTTEYKQLQEECTYKLLEYDSAIIYKNNMIQELSDSLKQSVEERNKLISQIEFYRMEVVELQEKVKESAKVLEDYKCQSPKKASLENDESFVKKNLTGSIGDNVCSKEEVVIAVPNSNYVHDLETELNNLKEKLKNDKDEYDSEIHRLRELISNLKCGSTELMELKTQLEVTHNKEMGELRKYFEKKCADLEKNYSEEIYSQHSRKLSGSSSEDIEPSIDLLLSNQPGPGGDSNKIFKTQEDLDKLKDTMNSLVDKIAKFTSKTEDLSLVETEVRNELNSLLKIGEKLEIKAIQNNYLEEISNLKYQLDQCRKSHVVVSNAIQEVASSGDFELEDIVHSYERRLLEQVNLARIDIISDLDAQFQKLLSDDCTKDEVWPEEFLKIKENFTKKHQIEIESLKQEHEDELNKLKDEHLRVLNSALERARRRSSKDGDSLNEVDMNLVLKERNHFRKEVKHLRNLISELVAYFVQCEDTLNNTLVDELLKQGSDRNSSQLEDDIVNLDDSSGTNSSNKALESLFTTRVHLTPNFKELISKLEDRSLSDDSQDISIELKNELGMCLKKLTQDANAILAMTMRNHHDQNGGTVTPVNTPEKKNDCAEQDKISLDKLRNEMDLKLKYKQELEDANYLKEALGNEKEMLEHRLNEAMDRIGLMEVELHQAKVKISELLECKEMVSEGYGEQGGLTLIGLGDTMAVLASLQEKARTLLGQSRGGADPNVLQLVEELCRISERIRDESYKEKSDLLRQIDVADKKYKTTQKFLEEQAQEREMERDEAQRRIKELLEQVKERERDRENCQLMSDEEHRQSSSISLLVNREQAQQLESQLEEATYVLQAELKKYKELESERDEAIEKVGYLREIIRELENQNDAKNIEIEEHIQNVDKLNYVLKEQHGVIDELKNLDSFKSLSDNQKLRQHIELLEEELQQLRISSELAGSEGATRQLKLQLFELETCLDKKTKDLEQFYQSTNTNSCSSPSEEMSVRDLVRPQTPSSTMDDCEVPLQQLARIKEKLVRHNRAEETALKRIRDLEMQNQHLKAELEEISNEKELLTKQIKEHIVLISNLQIRLDNERHRAEYIEKQTNTSLESKIYDLNTEMESLQDKLRNKEKTLLQSQHLLVETQNQLKDLQNEMSCNNKNEDEVIVALQKELDSLKSENDNLKKRLSTDTQLLVDKIIQDKNFDIEKLRDQLEETQSELQTYTSLNLNRHELKTIADLKNTGTSIEQILSIIDLSQPTERMLKYDSHSSESLSFGLKRGDHKPNDTVFLGTSGEISHIEKVGPTNLHYTFATPLGKPNSTEIVKSAEKKVRFEDTTNEIESLLKQLEEKQKVVEDLEQKLSRLEDLQENIKMLETQLDSTEKALTATSETFQREQEAAREKERLLGVELAEKKLHLSEREKQIEHLEQDAKRKDEMCLKLAREKKDLEQNLRSFKHDSLSNLDTMIAEKNMQNLALKQELHKTGEELLKAKKEIDAKSSQIMTLMNFNMDLKTKLEERIVFEQQEASKAHQEVASLKEKIAYLEQLHTTVSKETSRDPKISDKEMTSQKVVSLEQQITSLTEKLKLQEARTMDKDIEIEILTEDMRRLENELTEADERITELQRSTHLAGDKTDKEELNREIERLKNLVDVKDGLIIEMKEDYKVVKQNLHKINDKIQEKGNILDLSQRVKTEQKKNAELLEKIHALKAKLLNYEAANAAPVEAITDQLQKELNYSAAIDANILNAVSDQSLTSISEGHDVEVYKKAFSRQKSLNKQLMRAKDELEKENLASEHAKQNLILQIDELQSKLEKEKINLRRVGIEDSKLIEQMRLHMDALLEERENFERLVKEEKNCRRALEVQIEELKKTPSSTESTKYKSLPNEDTLELMQLKTNFEKLQQQNSEISKKLKELKEVKNQLENNLKYTKEMLILEAERSRNFEEKIRVLTEKEKSLNLEILQKKFEIDNRDTELEEKKIIIDELEQEKTLFKKQKNDLMSALKTQTSANPFFSPPVISETTEKLIQELKMKTEENKNKLEQIERLEANVRKLEAQIRSDSRNKTDNDVENRHLIARCDYLFAKTLKLESVRKSLIWQKRYLNDFLKSHRRQCLIEALPEEQPHDRICVKRRHSPKTHFRSMVYVVISIHRMQYLVKRWHNGIRRAEKINSRHYTRRTPAKELSPTAANFHVGQPVSDEHFAPAALRVTSTSSSATNPFFPLIKDGTDRPVSPTLSTISLASTVRDSCYSPSVTDNSLPLRENSWSGLTPPCKETRRRERLRIGTSCLAKEDVTPLKAPQLLAQFQERFHQIQEKLTYSLDQDLP